MRDDDLVWVHDYHLFPLAEELRKLGVGARIGFFLHIPLPTAGAADACCRITSICFRRSPRTI